MQPCIVHVVRSIPTLPTIDESSSQFLSLHSTLENDKEYLYKNMRDLPEQYALGWESIHLSSIMKF